MNSPSASASMTALLVEDDARLARFTADYLGQHGVLVTHCADGEQGLREALRQRYDVVVLDLMLPRRDGLQVCQALRTTSDVPIVIITARTEEADRVVGLELGADDYVLKPYSPRELLARMRAVVRRDRGLAGPVAKEVTVGALRMNEATRRALLDDQELTLTTYEFALLLALARRPGRVLSREQLLELVTGSADETFDRAIDVHVSRLRQKLSRGPGKPALIRTVRGIGYVLTDDPS